VTILAEKKVSSFLSFFRKEVTSSISVVWRHNISHTRDIATDYTWCQKPWDFD